LVGTGTSQHAAELGATVLAAAGVDARWASSASFVRSPAGPAREDAVVVLSQSGETAFARGALARARAEAGDAFGITAAAAGWEGAIETVAPERSQTYSVTFTAALAVLARLALALGAPLGEALDRVPAAAARAVAASAPGVDPGARLVVLAGAGAAAVSAREGSLKLREGARMLAEGYEAEMLLNGQAVPLRPGDALIGLAPASDADGLTAGLVAAARDEGISVHEVDDEGVGHPVLDQVALVIRLQRLALGLARARDQDPDTVIEGAWAQASLWARGDPVA
ncbi:MAG TPA: hypothetical protein VIM22_05795, partial [Solirubrobacteraceae bacterium]